MAECTGCEQSPLRNTRGCSKTGMDAAKLTLCIQFWSPSHLRQVAACVVPQQHPPARPHSQRQVGDRLRQLPRSAIHKLTWPGGRKQCGCTGCLHAHEQLAAEILLERAV